MNKQKIEEFIKVMMTYRIYPESINDLEEAMSQIRKDGMQVSVTYNPQTDSYCTDSFSIDYVGYAFNYVTMEYEPTYNYRIHYGDLYDGLRKIHREALETRNLEFCLLYDPEKAELYYYERSIGSNFLPSAAEIGVDIFLFSYEFHDLDPFEGDEFMDMFIPKLARSINADKFCVRCTPYKIFKYARDNFPEAYKEAYDEALEEYILYLEDIYDPCFAIEIIRPSIKELGYIIE